MIKRECISMILAGGQGTRLAALTSKIPKPAIPFGGMCRLIDFTLSNCCNSGIDTVGVLTSKYPFEISEQIGSGIGKNSHSTCSDVYTLPPSIYKSGDDSYAGTANAIYQNINFIEQFNPEYVLILSGDHVYKMNYNLLLDYHKDKGADTTISVIEVPWADASRFGIMATLPDGTITDFAEKPVFPKSNLASMGVYIFSWPRLKYFLELDEATPNSCHDFGKDIIPSMLAQGGKVFAYHFNDYWKDVGTVEGFHAAHMDLLLSPPAFIIQEEAWPVYSTLPSCLSHQATKMAPANKSLISNKCSILGEIEGAVIFPDTYIDKLAIVKNSVVMPGARIGPGAYIEQAIIGPWAVVEKDCIVRGGIDQAVPIAIVGEKVVLSAKTAFLLDQ
ncbi:MAG: glgC 4 [Firmicutes bacterium]|nr:glgC 4 [Bacillota bacterium]